MADIPERLAELPRDRRGLPIPAVNMHGDVVDFTVINAMTALALASKHRCGLCGNPLGYWIAFLGGPQAAQSFAYVDPPMHEECAEGAINLCPHIGNVRLKRSAKTKVDAVTPVGFEENRTEEWVMYLARGFKIKPTAAPGGGYHAIFVPRRGGKTRIWRYDADGQLKEA